MDDGDLTLTSIGEGIVEELYEDGLQKILANIEDEATNRIKPRKLVIEFTFEAEEEGKELDIHITSRVTTAPKKGRKARAYLAYRGGKRGLSSTDPRQPEFSFSVAAGGEK